MLFLYKIQGQRVQTFNPRISRIIQGTRMSNCGLDTTHPESFYIFLIGQDHVNTFQLVLKHGLVCTMFRIPRNETECLVWTLWRFIDRQITSSKVQKNFFCVNSFAQVLANRTKRFIYTSKDMVSVCLCQPLLRIISPLESFNDFVAIHVAQNVDHSDCPLNPRHAKQTIFKPECLKNCALVYSKRSHKSFLLKFHIFSK